MKRKLEKGWVLFGMAMFLLQLASLVLGAMEIVSLLLLGFFIVGCGLGFATLFRIIHHFTLSTNTHVTAIRVQHDKGSKAEEYLKKILGEQDETVEPQEVKVIKNDEMDSELKELHEIYGGE
jgi:hypothetical protein